MSRPVFKYKKLSSLAPAKEDSEFYHAKKEKAKIITKANTINDTNTILITLLACSSSF